MPGTEVHRFWERRSWAKSRANLTWVDDSALFVTRCAGWFLRGHEFPKSSILDLQRDLLRVVQGTTQDWKDHRSQVFFGRFGGVEDNNQEDPDPPCLEHPFEENPDLGRNPRGDAGSVVRDARHAIRRAPLPS